MNASESDRPPQHIHFAITGHVDITSITYSDQFYLRLDDANLIDLSNGVNELMVDHLQKTMRIPLAQWPALVYDDQLVHVQHDRIVTRLIQFDE